LHLPPKTRKHGAKEGDTGNRIRECGGKGGQKKGPPKRFRQGTKAGLQHERVSANGGITGEVGHNKQEPSLRKPEEGKKRSERMEGIKGHGRLEDMEGPRLLNFNDDAAY